MWRRLTACVSLTTELTVLVLVCVKLQAAAFVVALQSHVHLPIWDFLFKRALPPGFLALVGSCRSSRHLQDRSEREGPSLSLSPSLSPSLSLALAEWKIKIAASPPSSQFTAVWTYLWAGGLAFLGPWRGLSQIDGLPGASTGLLDFMIQILFPKGRSNFS